MKKILSILLAAVLVFCGIPYAKTVYADETVTSVDVGFDWKAFALHSDFTISEAIALADEAYELDWQEWMGRYRISLASSEIKDGVEVYRDLYSEGDSYIDPQSEYFLTFEIAVEAPYEVSPVEELSATFGGQTPDDVQVIENNEEVLIFMATRVYVDDDQDYVSSVDVIPATKVLKRGTSYSFTAEVIGTYDEVDWFIENNESNETYIDNETGILNIAENEPAESVEVFAKSMFNENAVGSCYVSLIDEDVYTTSVSISPESATINAGQSVYFEVTVTGNDTQEVYWTLTGNNNKDTNISDSGYLFVSQYETAETLTVTATAMGDPTKKASAVITVIPPTCIDEIEIEVLEEGLAWTTDMTPVEASNLFVENLQSYGEGVAPIFANIFYDNSAPDQEPMSNLELAPDNEKFSPEKDYYITFIFMAQGGYVFPSDGAPYATLNGREAVMVENVSGFVAVTFKVEITVVPVSDVTVTPYGITENDYIVNGNVITSDIVPVLKIGYLKDGAYENVERIGNGDGSYSFNVPSSVSEVIAVMIGDANFDGKLTNADSTKTKAFVKGMTPLSLEAQFAADVNFDGKVSNADSTKLKAHIKGMTSLYDLSSLKRIYEFVAVNTGEYHKVPKSDEFSALAFDGDAIVNGITATEFSVKAGPDAEGETILNIPSSYMGCPVTGLIEGGFLGITSVEEVVIPETVTSIPSQAFAGCSSLTTVTIPSTVQSVDSSAFDDCESLSDVYFDGTREQWDALDIEFGNDDLINSNIHCLEDESGRYDDAEAYELVLGSFQDYVDQAKAAEDRNERLLLFAQAEAELLDSAVILPMTGTAGSYYVTSIAYGTQSDKNWGSEGYSLRNAVLSSSPISNEEQAELKALYFEAIKNGTAYDPESYLVSKGHNISRAYKEAVDTILDSLDTKLVNSEDEKSIYRNITEGLLTVDTDDVIAPGLASSFEVSADGTEYTFHLREGVYWYTSEKQAYAELTADDFVAGMQHNFDVNGYRTSLAGIIKGSGAYIDGDASFDEVGCIAIDKYTLRLTLDSPYDGFLYLLTYSDNTPLSRAFYESKGGVFGSGLDSYADTYLYGKFGDTSSILYIGPFILTEWTDSKVVAEKNPGYYNASRLKIDTAEWYLKSQYSADQMYDNVFSGGFSTADLSDDFNLGDMLESKGLFDTYASYDSRGSVTYFASLNVNRGTFALENGDAASPKNEKQIADARKALINNNFRKALIHALDKSAYNAVNRGEEKKNDNLRNMLSYPGIAHLTGSVSDSNGFAFAAGTEYEDMVKHYLELKSETADLNDKVNGWYDEDAANSYLELAMDELGEDISYPIIIDYPVYTGGSLYSAAQVLKESIESVLGNDKVVINLVEISDAASYYGCVYTAESGAEVNADINTSMGWGADYPDPYSFLAVFEGDHNGYMTKNIGLF